MRRVPAALAFLPLVVLVLPYLASAQALTQATSLFNIFVGLMLVVSLLTYGASFIVWVTRLGNFPSFRATAIEIGEWAVIVLFVLELILTAVQYYRDHPHAAAVLTGTIVFVVVVGLILYFALFGEGEEKKERPRR